MVPIFFVLTILILVSVDFFLQRRRAQRSGEDTAPQQPRPPMDQDMPALPGGLFVHPGHAWAEIQTGGAVRVGFDGFLRWALGVPDRISMLPSGRRVSQGEAILALERGGRRILVPSPISGTIQATNEHLATSPQSLGEDPYGTNWAYSVRPSRLGEEIRGLRVAEAATVWLKGEMARFTGWLTGLGAGQPVPALQDGGSPVAGVLVHLSDEDWAGFQTEFLEVTESAVPGQLRKT